MCWSYRLDICTCGRFRRSDCIICVCVNTMFLVPSDYVLALVVTQLITSLKPVCCVHYMAASKTLKTRRPVTSLTSMRTGRMILLFDVPLLLPRTSVILLHQTKRDQLGFICNTNLIIYRQILFFQPKTTLKQMKIKLVSMLTIFLFLFHIRSM